MGLMDKFKDHLAGNSAPVAAVPVKTVGDLQPKPTPDKLEQFYQSVLPACGNYCLFQPSTKRHTWFHTIADLVDGTIALGDKPDIYFGTGTFVEPNARTQANSDLKKAFYFDLDAGVIKLAKHGSEKTYVDQQAAIAGILAFAQRTGLVPTLTVSSGEGLHVYWVLDEAIPAAQWTAIAKQFQKFGVASGLKIDSSVTADSARILRPVGTLHPNGKKVAILKRTGKVYSLETFKAGIVAADRKLTHLRA
jgi:DNA primase catalytic subunit